MLALETEGEFHTQADRGQNRCTTGKAENWARWYGLGNLNEPHEINSRCREIAVVL